MGTRTGSVGFLGDDNHAAGINSIVLASETTINVFEVHSRHRQHVGKFGHAVEPHVQVRHLVAGAVGEDFGIRQVVDAVLEVELSAFEDDAPVFVLVPVELFVVDDDPLAVEEVDEEFSAGFEGFCDLMEDLLVVVFGFEVAEGREHVDDGVEAVLEVVGEVAHVGLAESWAPFAFGISPVNGGNLFV